MEDIFDDLNDMQKKAVQMTEGPLLILAGAGSGKTRTIINRIAYILKSGLARPYQVIALTFTNKAAGEMRERISAFGIDNIEDMWMGTFHSLCARILRIHAEDIGFTRNFTIYDESDSKKLMNGILDELRISDKAMPVDMLLAVISKAKNETVSPEDFLGENFDMYRAEDIAKIYASYQEKLRYNNAMDFDDLLFNCYELFRVNEEVLGHYQNRFRYILVDEYQDTNRLQYEIIAMMARMHQNICVCGDDDQSIYGWRGADIRNILEFEQDFPDAEVIRLEQNYRSTSNILDAANRVIEHNTGRKGKTLWTDHGAGEKIHIMASSRDLEEADRIASEIERLARSGYKYGECAVLYRVNSQSRTLEEGLIRRNIPYQIVRGTRFYDRMEIKDILAYLRVSSNPYDLVSFERAMGAPRRGIGSGTIEKIYQYASFKGTDPVSACRMADNIPSVNAGAKEKLKLFGELILDIATTAITGGVKKAIELAIRESGYENALRTAKKDDYESRLENLDELVNAASDFENSSDDTSLSAFLENAVLIAGVDTLDTNGNGQVMLMTMHNSKGLEFPTVFIAGMEEGLFPLQRSAEDPAALEEERRLCYVAMTRAMKRLYISYAHSRRTYGQIRATEPSRFLLEIPGDLCESREKLTRSAFMEDSPFVSPFETNRFVSATSYNPQKKKPKAAEGEVDFKTGDKIEHDQWGVGTVITVTPSGNQTVIQAAFAGLGIKKFILGFSQVKKIEK